MKLQYLGFIPAIILLGIFLTSLLLTGEREIKNLKNEEIKFIFITGQVIVWSMVLVFLGILFGFGYI